MLITILCSLLVVNLLALSYMAYSFSIKGDGNPIFKLLSYATITNIIIGGLEIKCLNLTDLQEFTFFSNAYSIFTLILVTSNLHAVLRFIKPALSKSWKIPLKVISAVSILTAAYLIFVVGILGDNFAKTISLTNGLWTYTLNTDLFATRVFMLFISASIFGIVSSFWINYLVGNEKYKSKKNFIILCFITLISVVSVFYFVVFARNQVMYFLSSIPSTLTIISMAWVFSNYSIFDINTKAVMSEILDSMTNFVIVTDAKFKILDINKAGRTILNLSDEEAKSSSLLKIVDKLKLNGWEELIQRDYRKKQSKIITGEINEKRTFLRMTTSPMFRKEEFVGLTILATDITESHLKSIQIEEHTQKLEATNKELERFAYIASHDLKSPLRNVVSFLNLIERKIVKYNDPELKDYTYHARSGASQMYHLIQDVLEYSKVDDEVESKKEIDLNETMFGLMQELQQSISKNNGELSTCKLPVVMADEEHMKQLFGHIIENGFKYNNDKSPQVKISYREQNNQHVFAISDNGIGVEKRYYDQIFEMFKRLHTTKTYKGSGIGLSICRKIVTMYGGEIWLESNPKEGSTFFFTLN